MSTRVLWQLAAVVALCVPLCGARAEDKPFTDSFGVDEKNFVSTGKNTYFILEPGYQLVFEGDADGEKTVLTITVLNETKKAAGVETRVVEERETVGGKLTEVSRNYFAMDKTTSNVYYFGEDVDTYKDGKVAGHGGSWLAGENGAKYGMIMPGTPKEGDRYCQEVAPGVAMDRAEISSLTEKVKTPAGKFEKCLKVKEGSALNP
ncbi:MAG: hypothetical protein NTW87_06720, partial [Planctomycetota bacterium]|nr:hypothetical protein [Planctomycetota bacterium]